jgi:hypothetical protein
MSNPAAAPAPSPAPPAPAAPNYLPLVIIFGILFLLAVGVALYFILNR